MEKKKIIIIVLAAILSVSIITASYFIADARRKLNTKVRKEETHTMYVNIDSLVKLTFNEKYYLCDGNSSENKFCGKHFYRVIKYELIGDDAKKNYKNVNLEDESLYQAILILCDEAYSKKIEFDNVEIATDSESISDTDILNYIKSNSKNKIDYLVHVSYEKELNENSVFREENTKIKNYTVTFNSDGGTVIDTQKVEEGKKVTRPTNPTKVGYNFVEWRFNGKAFNFDTAVTQDITLEAVWEKIKATENNRTTNQNVVSQNVQEPEKNVDEGVQPSPDPPVEETPTVPEETPVVPEATPENQQPVE